jgi:mono/diheme cytochrome c family protein/uncharacterized membrane protein
MTQFFGSFHPVLVHLPIGILLIALLLEWLCRKEKYASQRPAIPTIFFTGAFTAILSCISGYFLSLGGEYDEDTLDRHKWMGIAVALVASVAYGIKKGYLFPKGFKKIYPVVSVLLLLLIVVTGHMGGSLTHGSNYLTQNMPQPFKRWFSSPEDTVAAKKIIPNVQEAFLYSDLVAPVFQSKCQGCHGTKKQKGGLRLDQPDFIMKGGKDGVVIVTGNAAKSELIKRLLLPLNNEDHMPPKEKNQLSENEIELLHWWIAQGADFTKRVKDFSQNDTISKILASFQNIEEGAVVPNTEVPAEPVAAADKKIVDSLRKLDVLVMPVAANSNYLSVSFVNARSAPDSVISLLEPLSAQLLFLKLGNSKLSDSSLKVIGKLKNLVRLNLEYTGISDTGIASLRNLARLQYLNLVGTRISYNGILQLKELPALANVYLYKTKVSAAEWPPLQQQLPKVKFDSGGYVVPTFAADTTEKKLPETGKKKKKKKE